MSWRSCLLTIAFLYCAYICVMYTRFICKIIWSKLLQQRYGNAYIRCMCRKITISSCYRINQLPVSATRGQNRSWIYFKMFIWQKITKLVITRQRLKQEIKSLQIWNPWNNRNFLMQVPLNFKTIKIFLIKLGTSL